VTTSAFSRSGMNRTRTIRLIELLQSSGCVDSFYRFGTQDRDVLEALALTRKTLFAGKSYHKLHAALPEVQLCGDR